MAEDIGTNSNAGKKVSEYNAMTSTAVYACVRVIAETVASLPLPLYIRKTKGKEKAIKHPLYSILHDLPNEEMTSFSFRETMMVHLLLWGNAYAEIVRDGAGNIVELYPLQPDKMVVERDKETKKIKYKYFIDGRQIIYPKEKIFHIPGLSFNGITGISPIAAAREAVGLSLAVEEFGARFFGNGARPGGILEHPGVLKDPEKLRKQWEEVYRGVGNCHKVAVLEEGMKYHEIGIPPEDAQFLQTRKFQINEICRIYRVPPHLIGDLEHATFSNIENQSIEFAVHTIRPWLVRWEQAIHKCLLTPSERKKYFAKFTIDGLLRGDFKTRMEGYAIGRQNGWYSANDIRELEDMNPIGEEKGGDLYLINGNMLPLNMAGAFAKSKTEVNNQFKEGGDINETRETDGKLD
ncbi:phage portal protein [Caloranaerobacter ferrireducens]|uniref:phage portal protein n=1 Tax=Caloranaerobacter ferrireducens TaxID=1323370 RepID=UPI00159F346F